MKTAAKMAQHLEDTYPADVLKLDDALEGEHIDTVLEWLLMTFKESNALEFASIDNRVALIKALSDPSVTCCLDAERTQKMDNRSALWYAARPHEKITHLPYEFRMRILSLRYRAWWHNKYAPFISTLTLV